MKLINADFRKGFAKVKAESMDDLWVLSQLIDPGDLVKGRTERKIKIGGEDDRKAKVVRKAMVLTLEVEKVEFNKHGTSLRVAGVIRDGPDDISRGSHHTLDLSENDQITIEKAWLKFQVDKLNDACTDKGSEILICVMERDEACFALLKKYGYDYLGEVQGTVQKKGIDEKSQKEGKFYSSVIEKLDDYAKRYEIKNIILASPAFWKEDLVKELKKKNAELAKIITMATCNAFGKNGIDEVLKRDEVKSVLKKDRIYQETIAVEELLREISKDRNAVYAFEETKKAADAGAIKTLLVTDKLIREYREAEKFPELDAIMRIVDKAQGDIIIVSEEHDAGKKLQGIGGIGGILRYKMNY